MDMWLIFQLDTRLLTIWASTSTAAYINYKRDLDPISYHMHTARYHFTVTKMTKMKYWQMLPRMFCNGHFHMLLVGV